MATRKTANTQPETVTEAEAKQKMNELTLKRAAEATEDPPEQPETFDGVVVLANKKKLQLKSVKLKYLRSSDFNQYSVMEQVGFDKIFMYGEEGLQVVCRFLSAALDLPYQVTQEKDEKEEYKDSYQWHNEITKLLDEMVLEDLVKITRAAKQVNGIHDENFMTTPLMKG